jgi:quinol monooxygenase YgiN
LKIKPGKLADFKKVLNRLVATTQEKDKGTLVYHHFINDAENLIMIHEHYENSEGFLSHFDNIKGHMENLGQTIEIERLEVGGDVTPEIATILRTFTGEADLDHPKNCLFYKTVATI